MIRELFKQCACAPAKWAKCAHPFHLRKQVHGRRWTVSLDEWLGHDKVRSVGDAEAVAADMIAAMRAGTFSPIGPADSGAARVVARATGQGHTFASVAATYLAGVEHDPERRPRYRENLKFLIAVITRWPIPDRRLTLGELPIAAIDNALLERFYKAQVAAGHSVGYRNKMLQFLRSFSRWAVRHGYRATPWLAPDDADHGVKVRKGARRDRRLALAVVDARGRLLVASEYDRLLAVAEPRLRDLCIATTELGARLAELTALRWRDVDLPRGTVTIWDSKDPARVKKRVLPISATLRAVLEARRIGPDDQPHGLDASVFGNAVGEPVASIMTAWENAVLKAHGVDVAIGVGRDRRTHSLTPAARAAYRGINLVFHDLRHEAASQWHESGQLTLTDIMFLLGHEKLETTQIYLNVRPEGITEKLAAFARAQAAASGKSGVPVAYGQKRRTPLVLKRGRKPHVANDLA